jgi:hypothetical protein
LSSFNPSEIYARRYNAKGESQGEDFRVNATTTGLQGWPVIAMDAEGNFVVAWTSSGLFAQRYNAAGEPQGGEIHVTASSEPWASVAMDADGDFVAAWASEDGDSTGIFAQRYNAAGEPQGGRFPVNSTTSGPQDLPVVAMNAHGDFVVSWGSYGQDGDDWGVFAQRFDAMGARQGGEFRVNTTTAGLQSGPSVAMGADGNFVVAWLNDNDPPATCGGFDIFAQRFDPAGNPVGGEVQVNSSTGGDGRPDVDMDADGDFTVAWDDCVGVIIQRFDAAGNPQGSEFQVDARGEINAAAAMDADGDLVVAWPRFNSDGWGVFAQRFEGAERVAGDFDGDGKADLLWRNTVTGTAVVWLMDGETRLDEGSIGTVPAAWQIAGSGDFNGDGKADILWRNSATGNAVVWQMNGLETAAAQSIGAPPLAWTVEQLRDTDGDGLTDIVWRNAGTGSTVVWRNAGTGSTVVWRMSGFTRVAAEPIGNVPADWQLR